MDTADGFNDVDSLLALEHLVLPSQWLIAYHQSGRTGTKIAATIIP